jgi:hypothetical protein
MVSGASDATLPRFVPMSYVVCRVEEQVWQLQFAIDQLPNSMGKGHLVADQPLGADQKSTPLAKTSQPSDDGRADDIQNKYATSELEWYSKEVLHRDGDSIRERREQGGDDDVDGGLAACITYVTTCMRTKVL